MTKVSKKGKLAKTMKRSVKNKKGVPLKKALLSKKRGSSSARAKVKKVVKKLQSISKPAKKSSKKAPAKKAPAKKAPAKKAPAKKAAQRNAKRPALSKKTKRSTSRSKSRQSRAAPKSRQSSTLRRQKQARSKVQNAKRKNMETSLPMDNTDLPNIAENEAPPALPKVEGILEAQINAITAKSSTKKVASKRKTMAKKAKKQVAKKGLPKKAGKRLAKKKPAKKAVKAAKKAPKGVAKKSVKRAPSKARQAKAAKLRKENVQNRQKKARSAKQMSKRMGIDSLNVSNSNAAPLIQQDVFTICPSNLQSVNMKTYVRKMLKSYAPDIALAGDAAKQMDAIIANIMDYLASTASGWLGRRKTLDARMLQRAVQHCVPKDLKVGADRHAREALERFMASKQN